MTALAPVDSDIIARLQDILGPENVITDDAERRYFAEDVYTAGTPALAVLRPGTVDALAQTVAAATEAGLAVFPRGGGMSYTSGYLPNTPQSVTVDLLRMNKVREINLDDMHVTVECGTSWAELHDALKGHGVRPPFWGSLSGIHATVGGGLSQNAAFFGSGQHGSAADSVIGLEVVLADGRVIATGSGAVRSGTPFFRHYGPDLTGLFTADAGALGIKAVATLKLIADPPEKRFASFNFDAYQEMAAAMAEIGRRGLASECFGFDPLLQAQRMKRESLMKDVKSLAGVMKAAGSVTGALKEGAKLAVAGRGYMKGVAFSCHVITEHKTAAAADAALAEIKEIACAAGGEEIENSIPKIISANPFTPLNNMIGPDGERWVPVHGIAPYSKVAEVTAAIEALFAANKSAMEKHGIETGYLFANVGQSAMIIEPVFFWPDALMAFHHRHVEDHVLKRVTQRDENLAARQAVDELKSALATLLMEQGAVHFQIGKFYRYKDGLAPESYALVKALKAIVDPKGLMNPGALGLG